MMKAAVWHNKNDVRVEEVPVDPPKADQVQIEVAYCGICGSDLHEFIAGPILIPVDAPHPLTGHLGPLTLGHEFSGTVVAVGENVTTVKIGDKVAPTGVWFCGECVTCREGTPNVCESLAFTGLHVNGAFAKYVNMPAENCFGMPEGLSMELGAMIEPIATGFRAVRRAGAILGKTAVVLGAGTIGLGTLLSAKAAGAGKVIICEMSAARKKLAKKCGADVVLDPTECDVIAEIKKMTGGSGADVSFECVGNVKTGPLAVDVIRNSGCAIIVGIFEEPSEFNFLNLSVTEKTVKGSLCYTLDDFAGCGTLLASGAIDATPMITGIIGLDDIVEKGFEELVHNKDTNIKILVDLNK